jgi:DtxR family Mn-dependent transcriptional regulator
VRVEDTLKHLYESEVNGVVSSMQSVAGAARLSVDDAADVLQNLQRRRLIELEREGIRLTATGREMGLHVLRAHRLWESYLADQTGFPEPEWHGRAHDLEHGLSPSEVDALSARLRHPTHDPHGDPIPTATGEFSGQQGVPLTTAPVDQPLRILHMEDEPKAVYAQLVAVDLHPGMPVRLVEVSPERVRLVAGGTEHVLAPLVAASVSVEPLAEERAAETPVGEPLSALQAGDSGRVVAISRRCRGAERRRLLDLGVLPGTVIRAELRSPNGDPTAYRIRDALIALRVEQADLIRIERFPEPAAAAA